MLGLESQTFLLLLISLGHFSVAKPFFSHQEVQSSINCPTLLGRVCVCSGDASAPRVGGSVYFPEHSCTYSLVAWCRPGLSLLPWVFTHHSHPLEYLSFFLLLSLLRTLIQSLLFFSFYILFSGGCRWQRKKKTYKWFCFLTAEWR